MTVVLVAPGGGDLAQEWLKRLEGRGHDVHLVAPSNTMVQAMHHVTTRGDTADVMRAIADAMAGVPAPVLLLDADSLGGVVTVEEVEAAVGTVVLAAERWPTAAPGEQSSAAPLRVVADVVVTAGPGVHQIGEPTHAGLGLLRVDAADADTDLLDVDAERRLRINAAAGSPQGVVDRVLGRWVAESARWSPGGPASGANAVTAVSVAAALLSGLLTATGTRTGAAVAALFLLLSVLLERVDGMLARARRTVTAFGARLDVTSDRLREGALVIGVAIGAAQFGTPRWGLATAVLAALTRAHLAAAASRTARGSGEIPCRSGCPWTGSTSPSWRRCLHLPDGPYPRGCRSACRAATEPC